VHVSIVYHGPARLSAALNKVMLRHSTMLSIIPDAKAESAYTLCAQLHSLHSSQYIPAHHVPPAGHALDPCPVLQPKSQCTRVCDARHMVCLHHVIEPERAGRGQQQQGTAAAGAAGEAAAAGDGTGGAHK